MSARQLVSLGAILRAHGVRGALRARSFNPSSTLLTTLDRLTLRRDGVEREVRVSQCRRAGDELHLVLEGVDTREKAEALKGHEICVPREALPPPAEGEYYLFDLVGLEVVEGDRVLGRVRELAIYPTVECVVVETEGGVLELPMIPPYLVDVDVVGRRIRVAHSADFEP